MVEPIITKQRTIYLMLKKVHNSVTQQFSSIAEKNLKSCGKDVLDVC